MLPGLLGDDLGIVVGALPEKQYITLLHREGFFVHTVLGAAAQNDGDDMVILIPLGKGKALRAIHVIHILCLSDGNVRISLMDLHIGFQDDYLLFFDFNRCFPCCQFVKMIGLNKEKWTYTLQLPFGIL